MADSVCHPQALRCFCSSVVPACLSDVDFSSLNFNLNYGNVSPKKSVLSCPYLLLKNNIRIPLSQKCSLFLCSFIMIGTDLERRTLKWPCFMWTWSIPVQTSHSGWNVLCFLLTCTANASMSFAAGMCLLFRLLLHLTVAHLPFLWVCSAWCCLSVPTKT